jgi:hypothetical protein
VCEVVKVKEIFRQLLHVIHHLSPLVKGTTNVSLLVIVHFSSFFLVLWFSFLLFIILVLIIF